MLNKLLFILSKKQKQRLIIVFFLMFAAAVLETIGIALVPILVSLIIDTQKTISSIDILFIKNIFLMIDKNNILVFFSFFLFTFFILKNIFVLIVLYLENLFFFQFKTYLSTKIFSIYIDNNYSFHIERSPSELMRNIIQESANISNIILFLLSSSREIMVFLTLFSLLLYLNPIVTITIFCLLLLFSLVFIKIFRNKIFIWGEKSLVLKKDLLTKINEVFNSIKFIKISNTEKIFKENFNEIFKRNEKLGFYNQFLTRSIRSYFELFSILSISLLVMVLKIYNFNFSNFLIVMSLAAISIVRVLPIFNTVISCITNIRFYQPSLNVIYDELKKANYNSEIRFIESKNKKIIQSKFQSLELKNINFSYNPDTQTLKNINMKIKNNDKIGIIGTTGSGKSTLLDIMLGLQKPKNGNLLINNNIFDFDNEQISLKVGYVPQDVYLLDSTILNNILVDYKVSDEINIDKINQLIERLGLSNLITRNTNGLNTLIGNNGIKLSGGERQRIGIARALINDPDILFLDEATSSLDNYTEQKIMDNFIKNYSNFTIVIIAHRLSTLDCCNKVFYIEDGKIKDTGKISELIEKYPELSKK